MVIRWMRTIRADQVLRGDYVRHIGVDFHVQTSPCLVPDVIRPGVGVVLRATDGRDRRVVLDASAPLVLLEVA